MDIDAYNHVRDGATGFIEMSRGLIAVWGKEAVPFLDGLITNSIKNLPDTEQMLAAFADAKGRLIAVIRVLRQGDRFLFETEAATREKVFQNLFRFTFAGDFFVEDLSEQYRYFELSGNNSNPPYEGEVAAFRGRGGSLGIFAAAETVDGFRKRLLGEGAISIDADTYETLRIEAGIPNYGVDMDETTIVPELGFDDMISYSKGCYIGQEIIARIHFRGHVAKQLTGLVFGSPPYERGASAVSAGGVVLSSDGRNAGRITSVTFSPKLEKTIALGYVRYEFLEAGTTLSAEDALWVVTPLPFVV